MANNKGYKRSWKNYLLDSNYQLRFTFTMMAIAAGLMAPLGWWVSEKSTTATEVALNRIDEIDCPEVLSARAAPPVALPSAALASGASEQETDLLKESVPPPDLEAEASAEPEAAVAEEPPPVDGLGEDDPEVGDETADSGERERPKIKVTIDDSNMPEGPIVVVGEMKSAPPSPEEIANSKTARAACQAKVAAQKRAVTDRRGLISSVMIASAVLLLVLLGIYGIKTTHRVAGPLHKVGLYLRKVEDNIYDKVYNLRKGDQLVEFYDHFKGAHAGLSKLQEEDRDRLRDAIALAKEAGLAEKNEELAALILELERLLAEKEESFVKKQA